MFNGFKFKKMKEGISNIFSLLAGKGARPVRLAAAVAMAAAVFMGDAALARMDDGETPGTTPISLVEEAYVAHRRGDYDEAIKGYGKIIQRRGLTRRERAIAYLLRGEAKRDAKLMDEAILDFTRALKQWPGYPQAHFFRGRVYEQQEKFAEAYADIAAAVQLDPMREAYGTHLTVLKKRMTEADLPIPGHNAEPVAPALPEEDE